MLERMCHGNLHHMFESILSPPNEPYELKFHQGSAVDSELLSDLDDEGEIGVGGWSRGAALSSDCEIKKGFVDSEKKRGLELNVDLGLSK